jgi:hypothetical protein
MIVLLCKTCSCLTSNILTIIVVKMSYMKAVALCVYVHTAACCTLRNAPAQHFLCGLTTRAVCTCTSLKLVG